MRKDVKDRTGKVRDTVRQTQVSLEGGQEAGRRTGRQ